MISNVIDINLKIKKAIIEIPPLQIPLNDMIGKSSSREMIVEKAGKTRFNNLLPSTNLFEEKTIRSSEILIEEELKKYFGHFRDGFKETIEQILNNIVEENENINEKKKIIFPSKQYLFNVKEEEETSSPKINSVKK